ncbi:hypothetical protein [Fluviicola sp.]|uniref:hypothetical protein n=1 Tax=Fluviicola sp. TaxID=1917219 RepID=UPI0031D35259
MKPLDMKRKKHLNIIILQIVFMMIMSCVSTRNTISSNDKTIQEVKEVEILVENWRTDSLGCKKLRTKQASEIIIDSLKLENRTQTEFLRVFCNPNMIDERDGKQILSYYFDAICRDGKFIDSLDHCIAEFTFKSDRLVGSNYICF